jgi:hypothetical protein
MTGRNARPPATAEIGYAVTTLSDASFYFVGFCPNPVRFLRVSTGIRTEDGAFEQKLTKSTKERQQN